MSDDRTFVMVEAFVAPGREAFMQTPMMQEAVVRGLAIIAFRNYANHVY